MGGRGTGGANILITVAVVAVLAAIALPSFVKAREQSLDVACRNNLRMLEAAKAQAKLEYHLKDADEPTTAQMSSFIPSVDSLHCPKGGKYIVGTMEEEPECSEHGAVSDLPTPRATRPRGMGIE